MATPIKASTSNGSLLDCQSPLAIKLVLLGATFVGKSCLVSRLVEGEFHDQTATMGVTFWTYDIKVNNRTVKFSIRDTAGGERNDSFASVYYRGAQAAIVLYDITNMNTFDKAKYWVKELQSQASPNIVIALSGNMADLASNRKVQFQEAQVYAEENNLLFMETSAKTAQNATEIFVAVAMKIIQEATYKENGWSPLMIASHKGQLDAVMALIETGAEVSQTNIDIKKALDVAAKNGRKNVVELLEACKTKIFRQQIHDMYEKKEQQIRQQKEETEKQLRYVRQQKEKAEKQLRDVTQQKEETEKQLRDASQGKEEAEKQLDDVKKQTEKLLAIVGDNQTQTEQLHHMWQQMEQAEQQLHEMRQQKEQAEQQLHDMRQQKGEMKEQIDAYEKRLKATESMLVTMQLKNKSLEQELVQQSDSSQITQTTNFIYYSLLRSSVPRNSSADENEHP